MNTARKKSSTPATITAMMTAPMPSESGTPSASELPALPVGVALAEMSERGVMPPLLLLGPGVLVLHAAASLSQHTRSFDRVGAAIYKERERERGERQKQRQNPNVALKTNMVRWLVGGVG